MKYKNLTTNHTNQHKPTLKYLTTSLYIHIPFCANGKCDYCDFYSVAADEKSAFVMDLYVDTLIKDIKNQIESFNVKEIRTAYIGGGTPSVLGAKRLNTLLNELNAITEFSPVEFTIEANPESVTEEFLSACEQGGINRLSLGVQTFNENSWLAVNRRGRADMLDKRLTLVSDLFHGTFSADLITGLPFQSEEIVKEDVKRLLAFNPAHVSLYGLTLEEGTPLEKKVKNGEVVLPDGDDSDRLWLAARSVLVNEGFGHYEVSNFAREGNRCLHNMRYWNMDGWLGAGAGASGTLINEENGTAKRFTFAPDLQSYIKSPLVHESVCEDLDRDALMRETLLMGYRLPEGPDGGKFIRRFGRSLEECIPKTLENWKEKNKMLFLNQFLVEAFSELGEN